MPSEAPEPLIHRLEPLRPRGLRVRVHLEPSDPEGEELEVALEAVERRGLGVGDPLPSSERRTLLEVDADLRARDTALNLLSHRARTRTELRRRLRKKGFEPPRIETCLDRLEERGLLDDAEVAASFVRDRLRLRPRGPARLRSELRAKGVARRTAERVVDEVLDEEEITETDLALRVAERWVARQSEETLRALLGREDPGESRKMRRRLYGYLGRRGFRGRALSRAMDHARDEARRTL
jgi:regulatory protein